VSARLALQVAIALPFAAGLVALLIPRRLSMVTKLLTLAVTALVFWAAIVLYGLLPTWNPEWLGGRPVLGLDGLSALILFGAGFFSLAMAVYSVGFLKDEQVHPGLYYSNFLWVVGSTMGAVLARDMFVLLGFWALMGIPFFLLINLGSSGCDAAAKKMLIVLGGTDSLMILGIAIILRLSDSTDLLQPTLPLTGTAIVACLCLAAAAFAKAGAMPFHSWVPDVAATSPVPVAALLPASLDKLLGIYLFARISLGLFAIGPGMRSLFLLVGAATVVGAVMAALVQHNLRRLLGFHAVSQVGYMVIGIASGTPIGVLGGLFHMVNHAIYKSCLFLTAGAAERRSQTAELDRMGGLARAMPITFGAAVVAAMAISGIPPLNGFTSKWMVYQGLIQMGPGQGPLWTIVLVAAMFGSALTLASFVKVLHSVFLGQPHGEATGPLPNALMGLPMALLALLCIVFGVFAYSVPVKGLLLPALPASLQVSFARATWQPGIAALLLCVALAAGGLIYVLGTVGRLREDEAYIGGEAGARAAAYHFSGVEFYRTVAELPSLRTLYRHAEGGWYDLYELGRRFVGWVGVPLQRFHSGVLLTYIAWCVLGLVVLLWLFLQ